MPEENGEIVRIECDAANKYSVIDQRTGKTPAFWRGSDVVFELALTQDGVHVTAAELGEVVVELKEEGATPITPNLYIEVVDEAEAGFTPALWESGEKSLVTCELRSEISEYLPAGDYWLIVRHLEDDGLTTTTHLAHRIIVHEDKQHSGELYDYGDAVALGIAVADAQAAEANATAAANGVAANAATAAAAAAAATTAAAAATTVGGMEGVNFLPDPDGWQGKLAGAYQALGVRASQQADGGTPATTSEVVHPSVVIFIKPWRGFRQWMCITPYIGGDASWENPSLLARNYDDEEWSPAPRGIQNPIAPYPAGSTSQGDVGLSYDSIQDELIIYYLRTASGVPRDLRSVTYDGTTVGAPVTQLSLNSQIGSPHCVPYRDADGADRWRLFYSEVVGGVTVIQWRDADTRDGGAGGWIARSVVTPTQTLPDGYNQWDFQAYRTGAGWFLSSVLCKGNQGTDATLYFATSDDDAQSFTYSKQPVVNRPDGAGPFSTHVYTTAVWPKYLPDGTLAFRAAVTGRAGDGTWGMEEIDIIPRVSSLPDMETILKGSFPADAEPQDGSVTGVDLLRRGVETAATVSGGVTSSATGLEFSTVAPFGEVSLATAGVQKWGEFSCVVKFRMKEDPAVVTGAPRRQIINVGGVYLIAEEYQDKWSLQLGEHDDVNDVWTTILNPCFIPHDEWQTVAFAYDGTNLTVAGGPTHDQNEKQSPESVLHDHTLGDNVGVGSILYIADLDLSGFEIFNRALDFDTLDYLRQSWEG